MKAKILQGAAVILIIEAGITHIFTTSHAFEESWIEGLLFIANFAGAFLAAYGIYRGKTWGWWLGFAVAFGSMIAYAWSRTTGLPYLPREEWFDEPWGTLAMITEGLFCLLVLLRALWRRDFESTPLQINGTWRYALPVLSLLLLSAVNTRAYQLDLLNIELDHAHVFFLWQVKLQPELSLTELEDEYGLQISHVSASVSNSAVDVRMRVIDPEKAEPLLEEGHFALLVGDQLLPAPHVHRHTLYNDTVIVLFPNLKNTVQPGTPVSVVFETLRAEPVTAQ